jgi:uncharacterized membrane protein YuzA (DUF378 family)
MSVASSFGFRETGAFSKPIIDSAIGSVNNASGSIVLVYNDILPVGNWLVCGSIEVEATDLMTSIGCSAGNGLTPVKYILSGFAGVLFDGNINLPFSYCFFSDGTNPNGLELTAVVQAGGTFDIVASPTIQIVRVG